MVLIRGLLKIARALKQANEKDPCGATTIPSTVRSSSQDLVDELLNHCRLFDSLISPIYSSEENESVNLKNGERKMLRRLVREFTQLLVTLQRNLERDERPS